MVSAKIIKEVREAKFFPVCADEAVDVSTKEQLPPILRFIDTNGQVHEQFIEFILCDTGTSGEAIASKITAAMEKLFLDL